MKVRGHFQFKKYMTDQESVAAAFPLHINKVKIQFFDRRLVVSVKETDKSEQSCAEAQVKNNNSSNIPSVNVVCSCSNSHLDVQVFTQGLELH